MQKYTLIKDLAISINSGLTPNTKIKKYWENGTINWLTSSEISHGIVHSTKNFITTEAINKTNIKINQINTISIAMYGEGTTRGKVAILKNRMCTNQAICNISFDERKILPLYAYYYLNTQYKNLRNLSSGIRNNLNVDLIKNFSIKVGSICYQQHIVDNIRKGSVLT